MSKQFVFLGIVLCLLGGGCSAEMNSAGLMAGAMALGKAATVSEAELVQASQLMRQQGDSTSQVADMSSDYAKRLERVAGKHLLEDGKQFNYKVYITKDINANASADGSIRFYSGLMDIMTDDELRYILGHEIGHIVDGDTLDSMRVAYTTAGVRSAAGSMNSGVGMLASSQLGALLEKAVNAQFSQRQEYDADAYALAFMKKYGYNLQAAVTALQKLAKLGDNASFLASHPAPSDRASKIQGYIKSGKLPKTKEMSN